MVNGTFLGFSITFFIFVITLLIKFNQGQDTSIFAFLFTNAVAIFFMWMAFKNG
jgi:hypothetical protein